ncbi:DUF6478 family protein [uncultured Limimaricola sp.]|uniref:DUF6478 family protein n=1 Tax=uncultured Limimaricola sp. TaxID=2211667 RepID=UPI0030F6A003
MQATSPLRQPGADWAWRPGPWAGAMPCVGGTPLETGADLGDGVRLFHDATSGIRLERPEVGPQGPWALHLRADGFDGGFVSLAIALPDAVLAGLRRRHLLGVDVDLGAQGLPRAFARLNLRQGPNSEVLLRGLPETGPTGTEFDLWSLETDPDRVESGWIDLIFEAPLPGRIEIADLVIQRRPRAAF